VKEYEIVISEKTLDFGENVLSSLQASRVLKDQVKRTEQLF